MYGTAGAADGFKNAKTRMYSMYKPTKIIPGINAPRNISPADVDVTSNADGIEISPVVCLCRALRRLDAWSAAEAS